MSKYDFRRPQEVENYLKDRQLEFKQQSSTEMVLKYCPFCKRSHNNEITNLYKCHINTQTGSFYCHRGSCNAKGSWFDFKNLLNGNLNTILGEQEIPPNTQKISDLDFYPMVQKLSQASGQAYEYISGQNYGIGQRGIKHDVLVAYRIGLGEEQFESQQSAAECVYFPMYRKLNKQELDVAKRQREENDLKNVWSGKSEYNNDDVMYELVKCKVRGASQKQKHFQKVIPSQAMNGIFGMNTVPEDVEKLIITEGEFDAMAAFQSTGIPSISLPFGAKNLPEYLVRWLDQYPKLKTIYIWLDEDDAGRINAPKMSKKLGFYRCKTVRPAYSHPEGSYPKDANDALRHHPLKIVQYIEQAKCELQKDIVQFVDLRDRIQSRFLRAEESVGLQCKTLPIYNKILKGMRNGEFTILTGPTGCGKTTLLSQLSLDFCRQGANTLWGSFEIKNERFLENMMLQFGACDLTRVVREDKQAFDYVCSKFEELPLYMMNFYGSTDVQSVIDTIEYAIHAFQISHVCLDNLQFMLGNQMQGFKKFDFQDEVIEKFRKIATDHDIHLSMVIHPKKVDEGEDLQIASVFGSAKATQEADNVFIIQNRGQFRIFDIKKNRYDGDIGRIPLAFDKKLKLFFELTGNQAANLNENKMNIQQIIEIRKDKNIHFTSILDEFYSNRGGGSNGNEGGSNGNEGGSNSNGGNNSNGGSNIGGNNTNHIDHIEIKNSPNNVIKEEINSKHITQDNVELSWSQINNLNIQIKQKTQVQHPQTQDQEYNDDKLKTNLNYDEEQIPPYYEEKQVRKGQSFKIKKQQSMDNYSTSQQQQPKIHYDTLNPLDLDERLGIKLQQDELVSFYPDNKVKEVIQPSQNYQNKQAIMEQYYDDQCIKDPRDRYLK